MAPLFGVNTPVLALRSSVVCFNHAFRYRWISRVMSQTAVGIRDLKSRGVFLSTGASLQCSTRTTPQRFLLCGYLERQQDSRSTQSLNYIIPLSSDKLGLPNLNALTSSESILTRDCRTPLSGDVPSRNAMIQLQLPRTPSMHTGLTGIQNVKQTIQ
jgi:hypothetical protein